MFTKTEIEKYFLAEKQESLVFIIIGVIALFLAVSFFFFIKTNLYKGASLPLLLIGLVQLSVGYIIYQRSDPDRIRNVYAYDMNPSQLRNEELPRMKLVNRNFIIYRWVEIICIITGTCLFFYFRGNPAQSFWQGLGMALAIQALVLLGADYFAEKRAKEYTRGLEKFLNATPTVP